MQQKKSDRTRKTFYAAADIFERAISARAKLVLLYFCRVADRKGECFPSLNRIAEHCGCSKNSARKAIAELEAEGLLKLRHCSQTTVNGKHRSTSNTYTLLLAPFTEEKPGAAAAPEGVQPLHGEGARVEREINDNSNLTMAQRDPSFKEGTDEEIGTILDRLQLDLYEDRAFSAMMEHVIRKMYHADGVVVKKQRVPRDAVRSALRMLTVDHIDYVHRKLREGSDVVCGEPYVMSCLYNAPIDCKVQNLRDRGRVLGFG